VVPFVPAAPSELVSAEPAESLMPAVEGNVGGSIAHAHASTTTQHDARADDRTPSIVPAPRAQWNRQRACRYSENGKSPCMAANVASGTSITNSCAPAVVGPSGMMRRSMMSPGHQLLNDCHSSSVIADGP
jgi:hypothetical protein